MNELNQKIEQWFHDKGIIENSNPIRQLSKTREEITEIRDAYMQLKGVSLIGFYRATVEKLHYEIKDGIGDTYVTLVGVCMMCRKDNAPENLLDYFEGLAKENIENFGSLGTVELLDKMEQTFLNLYHDIVMDLIVGSHDISRHYYNISIMLSILAILALYFDTTLEACVQQAYDVISKRTGKMVNGIFVKDA